MNKNYRIDSKNIFCIERLKANQIVLVWYWNLIEKLYHALFSYVSPPSRMRLLKTEESCYRWWFSSLVKNKHLDRLHAVCLQLGLECKMLVKSMKTLTWKSNKNRLSVSTYSHWWKVFTIAYSGVRDENQFFNFKSSMFDAFALWCLISINLSLGLGIPY